MTHTMMQENEIDALLMAWKQFLSHDGKKEPKNIEMALWIVHCQEVAVQKAIDLKLSKEDQKKYFEKHCPPESCLMRSMIMINKYMEYALEDDQEYMQTTREKIAADFKKSGCILRH